MFTVGIKCFTIILKYYFHLLWKQSICYGYGLVFWTDKHTVHQVCVGVKRTKAFESKQVLHTSPLELPFIEITYLRAGSHSIRTPNHKNAKPAGSSMTTESLTGTAPGTFSFVMFGTECGIFAKKRERNRPWWLYVHMTYTEIQKSETTFSIWNMGKK